MATSHLGISPTSYAAPAAFLAWNWAFAYLALSSRTPKQWYGIDHNGNPRQDLTKYAEVAIKEGKLTRAQLEQIQRIEAASANSIDGYTFSRLQVRTVVHHGPFDVQLHSQRCCPCLSTMVTNQRDSPIRSNHRRSETVPYRSLHHIHRCTNRVWRCVRVHLK